MNATVIVNKAKAMGVRLSLNGDKVKLRGPTHAVAAIKPEVAAHKPEIVAHLRAALSDNERVPGDCIGALRSVTEGCICHGGRTLIRHRWIDCTAN